MARVRLSSHALVVETICKLSENKGIMAFGVLIVDMLMVTLSIGNT